MLGLFGSNDKRSQEQKNHNEMSPKERREYDRKKKQEESDREWDHMMDLDALGFFDD